MSASEKLKTLAHLAGKRDSYLIFDMALPHIVAVVEAAELAMPYKDWRNVTGKPYLAMPDKEDLDNVRAALDALEDALS